MLLVVASAFFGCNSAAISAVTFCCYFVLYTCRHDTKESTITDSSIAIQPSSQSNVTIHRRGPPVATHRRDPPVSPSAIMFRASLRHFLPLCVPWLCVVFHHCAPPSCPRHVLMLCSAFMFHHCVPLSCPAIILRRCAEPRCCAIDMLRCRVSQSRTACCRPLLPLCPEEVLLCSPAYVSFDAICGCCHPWMHPIRSCYCSCRYCHAPFHPQVP